MADTLRISTWNINSVRLRQDQVLRFLSEDSPDILCLQETKCPDPLFPGAAFRKAGYGHQLHQGMKGYNGVAILSRVPISLIEARDMCGKPDARHIAARIGEGTGAIDLHNVYVPAGGDIADRDENPKFGHKLDFIAELLQFSEDLRKSSPRSVLVGDLNIAPLEHDVWGHKQLLNVVSHTPVETDALKEIIATGDWCDALRVLTPEPAKLYSWWSYRATDWEASNKGRRLDHIWLGAGLSGALIAGSIARHTRGWDRPSDHVPVTVEIDIS